MYVCVVGQGSQWPKNVHFALILKRLDNDIFYCDYGNQQLGFVALLVSKDKGQQGVEEKSEDIYLSTCVQGMGGMGTMKNQ